MLITTQNDLEAFVSQCASQPFLTIDTEFLREKTYYPKLCLIQIGMPDGRAAAVDPLANEIDLEPVFGLMRDKDIMKIFHAGRQDLEIFYRLMDEVPAPFFDTQIAAMVCGFGDSVGYENLVRTLTGAGLDKAVQFTDWSRRPLSDRQLDYALGDVTHLVQVYEKLLETLDKRGRTKWVFEEKGILAAPETYQNPPEKAWQRVKIKTNKPVVLAILRDLAAWRETKAQTKDIPRPWVMRDETLADMAAQMPKTVDQLVKIRNMPKDAANGSTGAALLRIIAEAKASDPKTWPKKDKKRNLPPSIMATVELLKTQLRMIASQYEVAAKLIASPDDLELIAIGQYDDTKAMRGWRLDIFGSEAKALVNGEIAIGLKDGIMMRYQISDDTPLHGDKG